MSNNFKCYKEKETSNIITLINGKSFNNDNYTELKANTVDAALEKHIPVYDIKENEIEVTVGSIEHPMTNEHYIMWIAQVTENNIDIKKLNPKEKAKVKFKYIKNSEIYAYCNLHGLWKTVVE